jgi:hypothetical protein
MKNMNLEKIYGVPHYSVLRELLIKHNLAVGHAPVQKCSTCNTAFLRKDIDKLSGEKLIETRWVELDNDTVYKGYHVFTCPKCSAEVKVEYITTSINEPHIQKLILQAYEVAEQMEIQSDTNTEKCGFIGRDGTVVISDPDQIIKHSSEEDLPKNLNN